MRIEKIASGSASVNSGSSIVNKVESSAFSDVLGSVFKSGGTDLKSIFSEASKRYGVSLDLLKAVAKIESNFNPRATSRAGAMGIMQLMPETAAWLGVTDAYDPEQNIMGGARLLKLLLNEFDGKTELALAAYNAGAGNVHKYNGIPPFAETQNYVRAVMSNLEGSSGIDIPEGYSSYQTLGEAALLAALGPDTDSPLSQKDYIYSALQLNLQMTMLGKDDEDKKIV